MFVILSTALALAGTLTIGPPNAPARRAGLTITPAVYAWGSVAAGSLGPTWTFTVVNTGTGPGVTVTASLSGKNAGEFQIVRNQCTNAMPPGGTCSIDLRFAPTSAGAKVATLTVAASKKLAASAALSGSGVNAAVARLIVQTSSLAFGNTAMGTGSAQQTFTVINTGSAMSGPIALTVSGTDASMFQLLAGTCGAALNPGGTCNVNIAFVPSATGARLAVLGVSAAPGGALSVALSGTGM